MKKLFLIIGCLLLASCNMPDSAPTAESTLTETIPTAIEPATTTPTFSPLPTFTQTITPLPLYFTDEFDTPSSYWQFLQTGGIDSTLQPAYENSLLHLDISAADTWYLGIHSAHTYSNVYVTAKVSASPTGSVGLICRYDEAKGWYEFNVASDGTYSALYGKWLAPGIAQYLPLGGDPSKLLQPGKLDYEIGLSCQDNGLNLYVDGVLLRRLNVDRFDLSEGNIGITVASFKAAPMAALFDWIKVEEKE